MGNVPDYRMGQGGDGARLWDTRRLASYLGVEPETVVVWRSRGVGPPVLRISRRLVRYDPTEVQMWLAQRTGRAELVSA